jgi:hypothetical protein
MRTHANTEAARKQGVRVSVCVRRTSCSSSAASCASSRTRETLTPSSAPPCGACSARSSGATRAPCERRRERRSARSSSRRAHDGAGVPNSRAAPPLPAVASAAASAPEALESSARASASTRRALNTRARVVSVVCPAANVRQRACGAAHHSSAAASACGVHVTSGRDAASSDSSQADAAARAASAAAPSSAAADAGDGDGAALAIRRRCLTELADAAEGSVRHDVPCAVTQRALAQPEGFRMREPAAERADDAEREVTSSLSRLAERRRGAFTREGVLHSRAKPDTRTVRREAARAAQLCAWQRDPPARRRRLVPPAACFVRRAGAALRARGARGSAAADVVCVSRPPRRAAAPRVAS